MSSQGFTFPPPPPPPPVPQQPPAYPSAQHGNGHWAGRGAGGRGRGRGHAIRGRASHYPSDAGRPSFNPPSHSSNPANYGYPPHPMTVASYMPPTQYSHAQSNYQHPPNPPYQPQHFSQPAGSAPYQPLPGYNNTNHAHPGPYPAQHTPAYSPVPTPQHAAPPNPPVIVGSVHWGAEAPSSYAGPSGHGHGRVGHRGSHHGNHGNHGPKLRHPGKRDHASAFNKPPSMPRTPAPPSVPSFGNPLPCKPPPAADATRKPNKRKRTQNMLGLTPKTEEHESSEEEEVADEDSKVASDAGPLQFTYKGRTATLQSPNDIAAWIAERKKRFPTAARIAEKKKAEEEANAAREAARREKEQERAKEIEKRKPPANAGRKLSNAQGDPALEEAQRAQRKADKIRRTLDREQKRFAKAEAEAEAARLKVEALQKQVLGLKQEQSNGASGSTGLSASLNGVDPVMAGTTDAPKDQASLLTNSHEITVASNGMDAMDLMSDGSDPSDWTSSSGSDTDSDSGSDDSAPEAVSSRREGPERVAPPPREGKKQSCRHFARTGQCNRGDKCKFSHETTKPGPKSKPVDKKGRKGLYQALIDQQKTEENKRAMEVIAWLGQQGLLEATEAPQVDT